MVKNLRTKYKKYDFEVKADLEFTEEEKSFQYSSNGFIGVIRRGLKDDSEWVFVVKEHEVEQRKWYHL